MKCQRDVKRKFSLTNNNQQRNQNQKESDELKITIAKKSKFPDRIKKATWRAKLSEYSKEFKKKIDKKRKFTI